MKYIEYAPKDKIDGLEHFKNKGYFLIDSIYEQIDKVRDKASKNRVIVDNIPELVEGIEDVVTNKRVKIIPIKKNVCKIIPGPLESLGYKVLNRDLPFPDPSQQKIFFEKLNSLKR